MRKFLWSLLYLACISLCSNFVGNWIPRNFRADRFPFKPYAFEQDGRFYERLHIRKWKDRVPDMSKLLRSLPRKALTDLSGDRVNMLLQETCVAEVVHAALMALALPVLAFGTWWAPLVVVLYVLGNLPFIMIQRYNRPRLVRLAEKLAQREERSGHA